MKPTNQVTVFTLTFVHLVLSTTVSGQWNKKAYTEWSEKEAQKVLDNSPWGQTQVFSNTSRMRFKVKDMMFDGKLEY